MDKWISVKDDKPPENEPVWISTENGMFIGAWTYDGEYWLWGNCYHSQYWNSIEHQWESYEIQVDDDYQPTHWMSLPNPPKE